MKLTKLTKVALLLTVMITSTTASQGYKVDAEDACAMSIIESGYSKMKDLKTVDRGHGKFRVTGSVKSPDDRRRHNFVCNYRYNQVANWNLIKQGGSTHNRSADNSNGHSRHNNNAAIGAGILAIAAIAAAANNDKSKNHAAGGNPFNDRHYLKRECRHNIKHHIEMAKKVKFTSAHLQNRRLSGEGYVIFEDGYERSLTYSCDFDRRGNIHDGHYRYRHRR